MADTIALSIVLTGRNDNHGGDFSTRFIRSLRFNWAALQDRSASCEVVFVEWNPVERRPTLFEIARAEVPDIAPDRFRGYVVDPRYHAACTQNPRLGYLEYPAKNVGIRRARGRMVLVTNTDIFFSRGVVDVLASGTVNAGVVHRATRIDLVMGTDQSRVTWDLLENPHSHARRSMLKPPLFAGASGDFALLDRESWHTLGGYNEVYRVARAGVDHNFLVKAYGCGYSIVDVSHPVYHVNHQGSFRIS